MRNFINSVFTPSAEYLGNNRAWFVAAMMAVASLPGSGTAQVISTMAGGGSADGYSALARLPQVGTLAIGPSDELYFSSIGAIYKIASDGTQVQIAGNGSLGYRAPSGDGGPARDASFNPGGFCIDTQGNIYIADTANSRIRKITPDGRISTYAGTGATGSAGDGGLAINAQLGNPFSISMSSSGDLYFLDSYTRVRKINPAGVISSINWSVVNGFAGDGGNIASARFSSNLAGLAVDVSGNIYIADAGNQRVRKIAPDGLVSTVAGNGTDGFSGDGGVATNAALSGPGPIAIDQAGNLYISTLDHRVRKVAPNGIISTLAGSGEAGFSGDGGIATAAQLNAPAWLTTDAAGNLFITDFYNARIRKVSTDGKINTVAGSGSPSFVGDGNIAANSLLLLPRNPAFDRSGNMLVADTNGRRVRRISPSGRITTIAGTGVVGSSGDGGDATLATLTTPVAVLADTAGNVYIADAGTDRVRKVSPAGIISNFAGGGPFIANTPNGPVLTNGDGGPASNAVLNYPYSLALDSQGNLYIGCSGSIRKVAPDGRISTIIGGGSSAPIEEGVPASQAHVTFVEGMLVDGAGSLLFVDAMNARIRKISPAGIVSTVVGNGTFGFAGDGGPATVAAVGRLSGNIALDADGNLFFSDENNHRVRKVSLGGIISTVAGSGTQGFGGDGSSALAAKLSSPVGVAIDASGDLFVADSFNNRIRKISNRGGANYTDMWWAGLAENGWGMSIQQHVSGAQFNTLFVYDDAGQPRWYVMPGGTWSDGFTTYSGSLYQPAGTMLSQYQSTAFLPGAPVGSATIRFAGSNQIADLDYVIDGVSGSKRLSRMAFGSGRTGLDVGDMWWGGTGENGWGVSIAQQAGALFSVWYTYGKDGKPVWFTMPGGSWTGNSYAGGFYSTQGSRWLGAPYDATVFRVTQAGNMSLNFIDANGATLNYTFTSGPFAGTSQSKALTRMGY